jgi:prolyl-tRNA synthetase
MKPRFGLIRAKEFLMKDLYTFDVDLEAAKRTYEEVNEQYVKIFKHIEIPFVKINADTGVMGGKTSHEYQILTSIGEDQIVTCDKCQRAVNKELCLSDGKICEKCTADCLKQHQGIEIGHTFILEDKYSKVLKATFLSKAGKPVPLQMGCYGIGVTRLIAACIEHLSSEHEIRWPAALAPFSVCIIPPKEGSKEESSVSHFTDEIYQQLDDAVVDDRTSMTIGKRLMEAKKLGIPHIIVIGAKAAETEPKVEVIDTANNFSTDMTICDAINAVKANKVRLS